MKNYLKIKTTKEMMERLNQFCCITWLLVIRNMQGIVFSFCSKSSNFQKWKSMQYWIVRRISKEANFN